jgi:hypothetical protein
MCETKNGSVFAPACTTTSWLPQPSWLSKAGAANMMSAQAKSQRWASPQPAIKDEKE